MAITCMLLALLLHLSLFSNASPLTNHPSLILSQSGANLSSLILPHNITRISPLSADLPRRTTDLIIRDEPGGIWVFFHNWGSPIPLGSWKILEIMADDGFKKGVEDTSYNSPITEDLRYISPVSNIRMHLYPLPGRRLTWIKWAHALRAMHDYSLMFETTEFEFEVRDGQPIATGFVKKLRR